MSSIHAGGDSSHPSFHRRGRRSRWGSHQTGRDSSRTNLPRESRGHREPEPRRQRSPLRLPRRPRGRRRRPEIAAGVGGVGPTASTSRESCSGWVGIDRLGGATAPIRRDSKPMRRPPCSSSTSGPAFDSADSTSVAQGTAHRSARRARSSLVARSALLSASLALLSAQSARDRA